MAGDTSLIEFTLTNPAQSWTPATMHVHTSWSDSCGGTFDAGPEDLDINQGDTASRMVTYPPPAEPADELADARTAAVPPGIYHALVSFDEISAKDRMIDAPYIRVDGTPTARNKADLYSIDLRNAVLTNENNAFNGVSAVFTGTNGDGTKGTNCLDWTSASGSDNATAGINATDANPNWTNSGTFTCSAQLPIYCVQQPDDRPR